MSETASPPLSYQRLAAARQRILTGASQRIPAVSLASQARALSLWDGRQPRAGDEAQFALLMDLAVFDPVGGHTRALDRQARADEPAPGTEDAIMLAALQGARFGLWRALGPHPEGGGWVAPMLIEPLPPSDPMPGQAFQVMDSGLPKIAPGAGFAGRLAWPEGAGFAMTCGALAACDTRVLQVILLGLPARRDAVMPSLPAAEDSAVMDRMLSQPATRRRLAALQDGAGIAAQVYRAAIDLGLMGPVPGRAPEIAGPPGRG
jgi:hypothetical protein